MSFLSFFTPFQVGIISSLWGQNSRMYILVLGFSRMLKLFFYLLNYLTTLNHLVSFVTWWLTMVICFLCRCCWEPICSPSTTTRCSNQSESSSGVPSPVTIQAGEGGSARFLFCFGNKTKLSWIALKVALLHVSFCCQTFSAILFLFTGLFLFLSRD